MLDYSDFQVDLQSGLEALAGIRLKALLQRSYAKLEFALDRHCEERRRQARLCT